MAFRATAVAMQVPTQQICDCTKRIRDPIKRLEKAVELIFMENFIAEPIRELAESFLLNALSCLKPQYMPTSQKTGFVFHGYLNNKPEKIIENTAKVITDVLNDLKTIAPLIMQSGGDVLQLQECWVSLTWEDSYHECGRIMELHLEI